LRLLSVEDLETLHDLVLEKGGAKGTISPENLDLIAARVDAWVFDQPRFPDVFSKAASYAAGLATLHPFTDGNKRTGYLAAVTFLKNNGYFLRHSETAEQMMLDLAQRRVSLQGFARWLEENC